eukprot:CAMPEP_0178410020 /NCGR_PEP_ID=MMETSP0689_2-20121128/20764_1 /TAXON_ID=160604 /ORGANISM="Amphidinium massartii, Strain CS-259" /LENGTH=217 /DNA_ID=CAMNT_0020031183 /DNA_START=30 /DNA_END=683 /DNA_ORIENTATION=-
MLSSVTLALLLAFATCAEGRFLQSSAPVSHQKAHSAKLNTTAEVPDAVKLSKLHESLKRLQNLKGVFAKEHSPSEPQASQFADGALSQELSNSDSGVWAAIDSMIGSTQQAAQEMKGKGKDEQKKLMDSLEKTLDAKAGELSGLTDKVSSKQRKLDEEYVLGLLLMHQKDWSMKQQLNATATFVHSSPLLKELYEHHNASEALAPQLAKLMDDASRK